MVSLLIFALLAVLIALATDKGRTEDPGNQKRGMTTGRKIALGIAVAIGALGLAVVGWMAFLTIAMMNYGDNK